ncbi:MAG TPA: arsenate reductase [Burkholderiales bacterium]
MTIRVYGIKNCDTMKKAFAWLDAHKIAYEFHDYKKAGVPPGKLAAWAKKVGWEKLANTRGPTWRKIPDGEKANLNEAKALALLEANSSAIRRPIVEAPGRLVIGFEPAELEKLA